MSFYTPPPSRPDERAFLVGVKLPGSSFDDERENIAELELLATSAGARVAGSMIQQRTRLDGSTYIGKGKLEELADEVDENEVNLVIFDDDLSPAQARNVEKRIGVNVIDRTELILDIFSRRARTRQARIQVEIAQLIYAMPRLRRMWDHLSRQAGGIGTRGPGETQLEVDRRRIRERIAGLKRDLERIESRSRERRKKRGELFNVTIVGYTNAGKSTLLNALSGSKVLESGRLFSTLDSTTRRVDIPGGDAFLLTDTVGFIRKLPAHLVASFHATLLDVEEADLLLHLVDGSASGCAGRIGVVNGVLRNVLSGGRSPAGERIETLLVINKTDLMSPEDVTALGIRYPEAIFISAAGGKGTGALLRDIGERLGRETVRVRISIPAEDGRTIALAEAAGRVEGRSIERDRVVLISRVRRRELGRLERAATITILGDGKMDDGD
jgi:GTP-binding protein HflX